MEYKFHPLADLFPMLSDGEATALSSDIATHGLHEPIVLYAGKILDGRNRYNACRAAGVQPRFVEYSGDNPVAYVVSFNLTRRHLNSSQRAMVAARLANMGVGNFSNSANLPVSPVSQSAAAETLNVSERSVRSARAVLGRGAPELVAAVEQGDLSVSAAADLARQVEPVRQAAMIVDRAAREAEYRAQQKAIRRALKEKPKLEVARDLTSSIYDLAGAFHYEDFSELEEHERVKPATFWEYLTVAGEDHAEHAEMLDNAIKNLKAIRQAMPRPSQKLRRAAQ